MVSTTDLLAELSTATRAAYAFYEAEFKKVFETAANVIGNEKPLLASDEIRQAFDHLERPVNVLASVVQGEPLPIRENELPDTVERARRAHRHIAAALYHCWTYQLCFRGSRLAELIVKMMVTSPMQVEQEQLLQLMRGYSATDPHELPFKDDRVHGQALKDEIARITNLSTELGERLNALDEYYLQLEKFSKG
jgi:hypothetical protein